MRYTLIAAALIGAVVAMPAAPASYGEAPASYGAESEAPAAYNAPSSYGSDDSENVYGTQVDNKQTAVATASSSTCTDEPASTSAVPYSEVAQSATVETTSAAAEEPSAPAYGMPSQEASVTMSEAKPEETKPAKEESPKDVASASEASPEQPKETAAMESKPAGYEAPKATEASPESPMESAPAADKPAADKPAAEESTMTATGSAATVPAAEATAPAGYEAPKEGETEASPESPAAQGEEYGSAMVPGAAPTAAPYPMGGEEAAPVFGTATGTMGAAQPTGTGSVGGHSEFEGAASSVNIAGLFAGVGAIAAFFM